MSWNISSRVKPQNMSQHPSAHPCKRGQCGLAIIRSFQPTLASRQSRCFHDLAVAMSEPRGPGEIATEQQCSTGSSNPTLHIFEGTDRASEQTNSEYRPVRASTLDLRCSVSYIRESVFDDPEDARSEVEFWLEIRKPRPLPSPPAHPPSLGGFRSRTSTTRLRQHCNCSIKYQNTAEQKNHPTRMTQTRSNSPPITRNCKKSWPNTFPPSGCHGLNTIEENAS